MLVVVPGLVDMLVVVVGAVKAVYNVLKVFEDFM